MNQERRAKLERIIDTLQEVIDDERDAYNNMPENLQDSEKGEKTQESLDGLEEARELLSEVSNS